jgi:hypothetical protein
VIFQHRFAFAKAYVRHGVTMGWWGTKDFNNLSDKELVNIAEYMHTWEETNTSPWEDQEPMVAYHLSRENGKQGNNKPF